MRQKLAPLKKQAQAAEKKMEKLIAQKEALEAKLADPKLYDGPADKVSALQIQLGEVVKQLDETEMAWLEASEAYEEAMAAGG